jgi:hypothetical protein
MRWREGWGCSCYMCGRETVMCTQARSMNSKDPNCWSWCSCWNHLLNVLEFEVSMLNQIFRPLSSQSCFANLYEALLHTSHSFLLSWFKTVFQYCVWVCLFVMIFVWLIWHWMWLCVDVWYWLSCKPMLEVNVWWYVKVDCLWSMIRDMYLEVESNSWIRMNEWCMGVCFFFILMKCWLHTFEFYFLNLWGVHFHSYVMANDVRIMR